MNTDAIVRDLNTITNAVFTRTEQGFLDINRSPTVFFDSGVLHVSAEDGYGFCDFYGEFRGGYPWIDPRLESVAKTHGCFWEWKNPACIALYPC